MAVAEFTLNYSQILSLARQLSPSDRKKLSEEVLQEQEPVTFASLISRFGHPDVEISDEEILAECDMVREEHYRARH